VKRVVGPSLLIIALAAALLAACTGPAPTVREGDAASVQVEYGGDVASAWPLARRHCAEFERVPSLRETDGNIASFDCIRR
jgi:hypothetical protein